MENVEKLKKVQEKYNLDLINTRFALNKDDQWLVFVDKENSNDRIIDFYLLKDESLVKTGFITYSVGKGFWHHRQVNLYKMEVDENFRGSGSATYGLSFLTEIANSYRVDLIDGKYYPSSTSAEEVYFKNGFKIERDYYDTRIVKSIHFSNLDTIKNNLKNIEGFNIYNNHRCLYIDKYLKHKDNKNLIR